METNYIALSIPIFLLMIGLEMGIAAYRGLEVYRFGDAITDISCGIGSQLVLAFFKVALFVGYAWTYENFALIRFPDGSCTPWIIAFFGVEIGYYFWHRMSHDVAFLWAVHGVHHQSEDYNLAVALRQAWFSAITSWPFYLPMALLGVPPVINITMQAMSTLYQFWIHTRLIGRMGWFENWFNTPSHHRVHHGRNLKYLDRNHGATLIVWDRLFGTFQVEEEEPLYGTVKVHPSLNPAWANLAPWLDLGQASRNASSWREALELWWRPPGWAIGVPHGLPAAGNPCGTPIAARYHVETSTQLKAYILLNFALCVAGTTWYIFQQNALSWGTLTTVAGFLMVTTLTWGGLIERRPWAIPLEVLRIAGQVLALLS